MREHGVGGARDVYAMLTDDYSPADGDDACDQIADKIPADMRGSYTYDAGTTQWEVQLAAWTPTPIAMQAVGEPFRAYVSLRSRDNGTSSVRPGGGFDLVACWNATTYTAERAGVSRVHRGHVLYNVAKMLREGLAAVDVLTAAWGQGREHACDLPRANASDAPVPIEVAIPGWYNWLLKDRRSELAGVLPGKNATHMAGLTAAFFDQRRDDRRVVRSDLANGWTRYIQEQPADVRANAQAAIGKWLVSRGELGFTSPI
jgi:hypothetical protein